MEIQLFIQKNLLKVGEIPFVKLFNSQIQFRNDITLAVAFLLLFKATQVIYSSFDYVISLQRFVPSALILITIILLQINEKLKKALMVLSIFALLVLVCELENHSLDSSATLPQI